MSDLTPEEMVKNVRNKIRKDATQILQVEMAALFGKTLAEMVIDIAKGNASPEKAASALSLAFKIVGEDVPPVLDKLANESPYIEPGVSKPGGSSGDGGAIRFMEQHRMRTVSHFINRAEIIE